MRVDQRKIPGNIVQAKAYHVTHKTKADRHFGSRASETLLDGVVQGVEYHLKPGSTKRQCKVVAVYNIAGYCTKTIEISLRLLTLKPTAPVVEVVPVPVKVSNRVP